MATTTNYSWTTPDDTSLVKDGAAAIRSLGSSIDTTTKALNPQTTTGALAYRSATANVNTALPIGTEGQVLTVASGLPAWGTAATGGQTLISTTTLSGSSVTLSSIPQTYKDLKIVIRSFKPATDDAQLQIQVNSDSTANRHNAKLISDNTATAFLSTSWAIGQSTDSTATTNLQVVYLYDYTNTTTWKFGTNFNATQDYTTPTSVYFSNRSIAYNQTSAISSLKFQIDVGGNFTSGTVLLYGVS